MQFKVSILQQQKYSSIYKRHKGATKRITTVELRKQFWFHFRIHGGLDPDEYKSYKESFDAFDWNNNGKISYTSLQV